MEIQFTIKLVGSRTNAALLTKQQGDPHAVVEGKSLGEHKGLAANAEKTPGKGGGAGDPPDSGGGGGRAGMGQVIVIGPIVICGEAASDDGTGGGAGDDAGTGGQKPQTK
jgi:hypothetical protein